MLSSSVHLIQSPGQIGVQGRPTSVVRLGSIRVVNDLSRKYVVRPTNSPPSPVNYARNTLNVSKLAVTGYCFGGRYSFRFVDAARTVKADVAFAAHPSAWEDGEVSAIGAATAVATAGKLSPHLYLAKVKRHVGAHQGWLSQMLPVMTRANCVHIYV